MDTQKITQNSSRKAIMFNCTNPLDSFRCSECTNFETYKLVDLKQHAKAGHTLTNSKESMYECQGCSLHTYSKYLILRHQLLNLCSSNTKVKSEEIQEKNGELHLREICQKMLKATDCSNLKINKVTAELSKCEYCDFQTEDKRIFLDHIKRCFDTTPSKSPVKIHLKKNKCGKNKLFKCEYCSYTTDRAYQSKQHILRKHTDLAEIRWFKCEHCSYYSKTKETLKRHIGCKHTHPERIRWFPCEQCPFKTKKKCNLQRHIGCKHTQLNEMGCEHCWHKSKAKMRLNQHDRTKFNCDYCQFGGKFKGSLKSHIKAAFTHLRARLNQITMSGQRNQSRV